MPYVLAVAGYHMWWGGHSTPARFLVPVLLPLSLPVAAWWQRYHSRLPRTVGMALLIVSVALTATLVWLDAGAAAYNQRDGYATWLDAAAPAVNLARALPSLFQTGMAGAWARALAWAASVGVVLLALRVVDRRIRGRGPWILAAGGATCASLIVGASAGWRVSGGRPLEPGSSAVAWAAHACRGTGLGVSLAAPDSRGLRALAAGLDIPDASRRPRALPGTLWAASDVPPGEYAVRLDSGVAATGTLSIALGQPDRVLTRCELHDAGPGTTGCRLDLPAGAAALWLVGDAALQRSAPRLSLGVVSLGPRGACGLRAGRAVASAEASLLVVGGRVYAEDAGAWVEGGREGRFVVRAPGTELHLRLRNGPVANTVRLDSGGWHETLTLAPGETREVAVPARAAGTTLPLAVSSSEGFRPADADPTSHDLRWLGVWVELG